MCCSELICLRLTKPRLFLRAQSCTTSSNWADRVCRNIFTTWEVLRCARPPIHVPLGYVPELRRIQASKVQNIDVLFYGSLNERRSRILQALKDSGVKVHSAFGVYGKERDALIARSKIV